MPSSRRQIGADRRHVARRRRRSSGATAGRGRGTAARPRTPATSSGRRARSGTGSGATGSCTSPGTPSASRLVVRTRTPGQRAEQGLDQRRDRLDQVLAVVQHQQALGRAAGRPSRSRRPVGGGTALDADAQRVRDGVREHVAFGHRRQPHEQRAVPEPGRRARAASIAEGGLARATRPGEGDQPGRREQLDGPCQLVVAPDERGGPQRHSPPLRRPRPGLLRPRRCSAGAGLREPDPGAGSLPSRRAAPARGRCPSSSASSLPGPPVYVEGFGLPAGVEQRCHQLPDQPLPGRSRRDDRFEVGGDLLVPARG